MPVQEITEPLMGSQLFQYWYATSPGGQSSQVKESQRYYSYKSGNWDRKRPVPLDKSPYKRTVEKSYHMRGEISGPTQYGDFRRYSGQFYGSYPHSWGQADERVRLRNEALLDALSNLKDQKFNAGVALAEMKGTAQMATDIGSAIASLRRGIHNSPKEMYDYFKKSKVFKPFMSYKDFKDMAGKSLNRADRLSVVPLSWTYYHFGIKPTMSDLDAIHQDWFRRHGTTPENYLVPVIGRARHFVQTEADVPYDVLTARMKHVDDQRYRVRLEVRLRDGFLAKLAQMGGSNIPEALWNGVPYSWLVDYFISFGDWLHALDAGMGYEFGQTVESYHRTVKADASQFWNSTSPSVPKGAALVHRPYRFRRIELDRTLPAGLYPPMYATIPMVKLKGPTVGKFANMLSVLALSFGRNVPRVAKY